MGSGKSRCYCVLRNAFDFLQNEGAPVAPSSRVLVLNSAYETTVLKAKLSYLYTILSFSAITLRLKLGYENRSRNLATALALTVEELRSWFFTQW